MAHSNPILVEVTRGDMVESVHRGSALVLDAGGQVVAQWGNTERLVYPRSSAKPVQAIPLVESGAADAFELGPEELALACASHSGEPVHIEKVRHWLDRIGLDEGALECGAHPPKDQTSAEALARRGNEPTPIHNTCSGKHSGILTVCQHLDYDPSGYTHPDHPVQDLLKNALERLTGDDIQQAPLAVDGCGIPVYGISMRGLALAMTRFAVPEKAPPGLNNIVQRIRSAVLEHPYMVAGNERFDTVLMENLENTVMAKCGWEGVYCAAVADRGLGIALKIDDGAGRAAEVALAGILQLLGAIPESASQSLMSYVTPTVYNVAHAPVGEVRATVQL